MLKNHLSQRHSTMQRLFIREYTCLRIQLTSRMRACVLYGIV